MEEKNENVEEVKTETPVEAPVAQPEAPVETPAVPPQQPPQPEVATPAPESKTESMEPILDQQKKGNNTVIIIAAVAVVAILACLGLLLPSLLMNKKQLVSHEIGVVFKEARKSLDKLDKNSLKYNLDSDVVGITGNVSFDSDYKDSDIDLTKLKNYKISYEGVIDKKNNKASGFLKLDGSKSIIDVNAMMKGKEVFISLGDLYNKTLYTETDQEIKDLEVSSVTADDIKIVLDKTEKTLKENIKDEDITKDKVTKEINGKKGSYQKISYKVNTTEHTKKLLEAYKNDDSVVDVFARMTNTKEKDVKEALDKSLENVKSAEAEELVVNVYASGLVPKTKEIELVFEDGTIVIDVDNEVYNYKLVDDDKELATGSYNTKKQEFTFKMDEEGTKVELVMSSPSDNKIVGSLDATENDMTVKMEFELNNKISGKTANTDVEAKVAIKSGEENMKFSVKSQTKATVGAKVNDISTGNTVKVDEISDTDMNNIYNKLMDKLEPVIRDIMPSASTTNYRRANA